MDILFFNKIDRVLYFISICCQPQRSLQFHITNYHWHHDTAHNNYIRENNKYYVIILKLLLEIDWKPQTFWPASFSSTTCVLCSQKYSSLL